MSLDWNIGRCLDYKASIGPNTLGWQVTERLIFETMTIGLSKITAGNIAEWRFRLLYADRIGIIDKPVSVDDLTKRIGLYTNASALTRPAFLRKMHLSLVEDIERIVRLESKRKQSELDRLEREDRGDTDPRQRGDDDGQEYADPRNPHE